MKYAGDRGEPYLDANTGVLRNRLGIKDQAGLEKAESSLSFLRASELAAKPVKGKFDLLHLQKIHHRLFGDVCDWAGHVRQVDIANKAGHYVDWRGISQDEMIQASVDAYNGDSRTLASLIHARIVARAFPR